MLALVGSPCASLSRARMRIWRISSSESFFITSVRIRESSAPLRERLDQWLVINLRVCDAHLHYSKGRILGRRRYQCNLSAFHRRQEDVL